MFVCHVWILLAVTIIGVVSRGLPDVNEREFSGPQGIPCDEKEAHSSGKLDCADCNTDEDLPQGVARNNNPLKKLSDNDKKHGADLHNDDVLPKEKLISSRTRKRKGRHGRRSTQKPFLPLAGITVHDTRNSKKPVQKVDIKLLETNIKYNIQRLGKISAEIKRLTGGNLQLSSKDTVSKATKDIKSDTDVAIVNTQVDKHGDKAVDKHESNPFDIHGKKPTEKEGQHTENNAEDSDAHSTVDKFIKLQKGIQDGGKDDASGNAKKGADNKTHDGVANKEKDYDWKIPSRNIPGSEDKSMAPADRDETKPDHVDLGKLDDRWSRPGLSQVPDAERLERRLHPTIDAPIRDIMHSLGNMLHRIQGSIHVAEHDYKYVFNSTRWTIMVGVREKLQKLIEQNDQVYDTVLQASLLTKEIYRRAHERRRNGGPIAPAAIRSSDPVISTVHLRPLHVQAMQEMEKAEQLKQFILDTIKQRGDLNLDLLKVQQRVAESTSTRSLNDLKRRAHYVSTMLESARAQRDMQEQVNLFGHLHRNTFLSMDRARNLTRVSWEELKYAKRKSMESKQLASSTVKALRERTPGLSARMPFDDVQMLLWRKVDIARLHADDLFKDAANIHVKLEPLIGQATIVLQNYDRDPLSRRIEKVAETIRSDLKSLRVVMDTIRVTLKAEHLIRERCEMVEGSGGGLYDDDETTPVIDCDVYETVLPDGGSGDDEEGSGDLEGVLVAIDEPSLTNTNLEVTGETDLGAVDIEITDMTYVSTKIVDASGDIFIDEDIDGEIIISGNEETTLEKAKDIGDKSKVAADKDVKIGIGSKTTVNPNNAIVIPGDSDDEDIINDVLKTKTTPTHTAKPTTAKPNTAKPTTVKPSTIKSSIAIPATTGQPAAETTKAKSTTTTTSTAKPAATTLKPAGLTTKPVEVTTKPTEITTKPAVVTTKPTEITTKPAEVTTKPAVVTITTKPAEVTTKPAEVTTKPAEVTTKPAEVTAKPAEVTTMSTLTTTEEDEAEGDFGFNSWFGWSLDEPAKDANANTEDIDVTKLSFNELVRLRLSHSAVISREIYSNASSVKERSEELSQTWEKVRGRFQQHENSLLQARAFISRWQAEHASFIAVHDRVKNVVQDVALKAETVQSLSDEAVKIANEKLERKQEQLKARQEQAGQAADPEIVSEARESVAKVRQETSELVQLTSLVPSLCRVAETHDRRIKANITELRQKIEQAKLIASALQVAVKLDGSSHLSVPVKQSRQKANLLTNRVDLVAKVTDEEGVLVAVETNDTGSFALMLEDRSPKILTFDDGKYELDDMSMSMKLEEGTWYRFVLERIARTFNLTVYDTNTTEVVSRESVVSEDDSFIPAQSPPIAVHVGGLSDEYDNYGRWSGCLGSLAIDGQVVSLVKKDSKGKLLESCTSAGDIHKTGLVLDGSGYAQYDLHPILGRQRSIHSVGVKFRTSSEGTLLSVSSRQLGIYARAVLEKQGLVVQMKLSRGGIFSAFTDTPLPGADHSLQIHFNGRPSASLDGTKLLFKQVRDVINVDSLASKGLYLGSAPGFNRSLVGCIHSVTLNKNSLLLSAASKLQGAYVGTCRQRSCVTFSKSSSAITRKAIPGAKTVFATFTYGSVGPLLQYMKNDKKFDVTVSVDGTMVEMFEAITDTTEIMPLEGFSKGDIVAMTLTDDEKKVWVKSGDDSMSIKYETGGGGGWGLFGGGDDKKDDTPTYKVSVGASAESDDTFTGQIGEVVVNGRPIDLPAHTQKNKLGVCEARGLLVSHWTKPEEPGRTIC